MDSLQTFLTLLNGCKAQIANNFKFEKAFIHVKSSSN